MKNLLFVGLDVDDNAFHATIINQNTGETWYFKSRPNIAQLTIKLLKIHGNPKDFKICYESTYLGFSLCRELRAKEFNCDVIASGLIPENASARVKTDRCDSMKLAKLYLKDMLTIVHIPDEEDEAERDLIRARGLIKDQIVATKNKVQSILRKSGINFRQETKLLNLWTDKYRKWLYGRIAKMDGGLKINLTLLLSSLEHLESTLKTYHFEIENLANTQKYKKKVQSLVAYRGIETLTAMKVITELGDIRRFQHPKKLMSYLGFDVCEYSSGGIEKKFGITKMGNTIVRTALVEATQRCYLPPKISYQLKHRRKDTSPILTTVADKCMKRLYRKSNRLKMREKHINKVKVACAREMAGFIWESLHLAS